MSEFHNLLSRLNEKDILLSTPKMDNSNYTEALNFLTGRELRKLKRSALAEYQDLERQLEEAERRIDVMDYYICDEDRPRIERELKEKGDE